MEIRRSLNQRTKQKNDREARKRFLVRSMEISVFVIASNFEFGSARREKEHSQIH